MSQTHLNTVIRHVMCCYIHISIKDFFIKGKEKKSEGQQCDERIKINT